MREWHIVSTRRMLAFIALLFLVWGCRPAGGYNGIHLDLVKLPPGFKIDLYAADIPEARSMVMSPGGILFGFRRPGRRHIPNNLLHRQPIAELVAQRSLPENIMLWRESLIYVKNYNESKSSEIPNHQFWLRDTSESEK